MRREACDVRREAGFEIPDRGAGLIISYQLSAISYQLTAVSFKEELMFVAMNRFRVNDGRGAEFEEGWRRRESELQGVDGFLQFMLLRGDEPGDYVSHTTWVSREAFVAWAQSEHFRRAHGVGMPDGILASHPRASFYDAVLVERVG